MEVSQNDVEIINDPTISNIVDKLLDNADFKNKCLEKLKLIIADNKLDYKDIPNVVAIIMLIHKTEKTINISADKMKDVFEMLILRLLKELEAYTSLSDQDKEYINSAIDMAITLLLINITSGKIVEFFKKYFCCCLKKKETIEEQNIKVLESKLKK